MNDVLNSGTFSLASLIVSMVVLVVGLAIWFFVNRASSRANEQIELLEALLISRSGKTHCCAAFAKQTNQKKKLNPQQRQANRKRISFVWLLNDNAHRGAGRSRCPTPHPFFEFVSIAAVNTILHQHVILYKTLYETECYIYNKCVYVNFVITIIFY